MNLIRKQVGSPHSKISHTVQQTSPSLCSLGKSTAERNKPEFNWSESSFVTKLFTFVEIQKEKKVLIDRENENKRK